jgi:hypothetical protein
MEYLYIIPVLSRILSTKNDPSSDKSSRFAIIIPVISIKKLSNSPEFHSLNICEISVFVNPAACFNTS